MPTNERRFARGAVRSRAGLLAQSIVASTFVTACAAGPPPASTAFDCFVEQWPGDYDNLHQPPPYVPTRLHLRRVDLTAFGDRVVYAEWVHASDGRVLRQRIYAFSVDADGRWRLALHIWPADRADFVARTSGAWQHPARLVGVTPADMAGLEGCDVLFAPVPALPVAGPGSDDARMARMEGVRMGGPRIDGEMARGACRIPSPGVARAVYSWTRMRRTADEFAYRDGWFFADDDTPWREFSPDWYEFRRARAARPSSSDKSCRLGQTRG
jgi:hypothetical protein